MTPFTRPSLATGKQCLRILYFPVLIAHVPIPAIARPRIKVWEFDAKVHRRDPTSKVMNPRMKTGFSENTV